MPKYIIYFNQQWVGDHTSEWFSSRGPLARKVVADMQEAGVVVFAGGLVEEIEEAGVRFINQETETMLQNLAEAEKAWQKERALARREFPHKRISADQAFQARSKALDALLEKIT